MPLQAVPGTVSTTSISCYASSLGAVYVVVSQSSVGAMANDGSSVMLFEIIIAVLGGVLLLTLLLVFA